MCTAAVSTSLGSRSSGHEVDGARRPDPAQCGIPGGDGVPAGWGEGSEPHGLPEFRKEGRQGDCIK